MKVVMTRNVIEIDIEDIQELMQDNSVVDFSNPQFLFPKNKYLKKRNRRSNRREDSRVVASQIIDELIQGLEK